MGLGHVRIRVRCAQGPCALPSSSGQAAAKAGGVRVRARVAKAGGVRVRAGAAKAGGVRVRVGQPRRGALGLGLGLG